MGIGRPSIYQARNRHSRLARKNNQEPLYRAECYEESPSSWKSRLCWLNSLPHKQKNKQTNRQTINHTQNPCDQIPDSALSFYVTWNINLRNIQPNITIYEHLKNRISSKIRLNFKRMR